MRAIRCVIATVLLLPAAAFAQTITSSFQTINPSGAISVNIGKAACQGNTLIDFTVDFTATGSTPTTGTDTLTFYVTADTTSCTNTSADPPGTAINGQLDQPVVRTSVSIAELIKGLPGGCNDTTTSASNPHTVFFCSRRKSNTIAGSTLNAVSFPVNFALTGPKPPSNVLLTPGDAHLRASWTSNDTNDRSWDVFVVPHGGTPDPNRPVTTGLQTTNVDLQNTQGGAPLVNGAPYDVYVRSVDGYRNTSDLSTPPGTETPILIEDFYNHYRNENGSDRGGGGCASGGAGALAVLGAGVALLFRRRRKAGVLLALLFVAAAPAARAEWQGQDRTPRRLLLAFKMDRYDPQIDTEAGLTGRPYHDIFHGHAPLRYQLEADWEVAHPFGSILLGGTVGFWQNYGHGLVPGTTTASSDTTHLNIAPFGAVVTYRFDMLADRFRWFPVIPYAQAGLMSALWTSYNGRGDVSSKANGGGHGSGWSYGYTTAVGVAFSLDSLDPQLSREAYLDAGVQRTTLFAEYGWTRLDEFKKGGAMILSDRAWRFGLSVEF